MRISIDPKDAGFAPYREILAQRERVNVFFNGELQLGATIMADTGAGTMLRDVMHKNLLGGVMTRVVDTTAPARKFKTETVSGEVRIDVMPMTPRVRAIAPTDAGMIAAAQAKRARKAARLGRVADAGGVVAA